MEELIEYLIIRFKTSEHCVIVCAEGAGQVILLINILKYKIFFIIISNIIKYKCVNI